MREDIIRYKGTNPLVGIPATVIGPLAWLCLVITIGIALRPDERSWVGFIKFISLFIGTMASISWGLICFGHIMDRFTPCVIYLSKKMVRIVVTLACLVSLAAFLIILSRQEKPTFSSTANCAYYALSLLGAVLLLAQLIAVITIDTPAKAKPDRKELSPWCLGLSTAVGTISCFCLALYKHNHEMMSTNGGESLFFVFTVSAISLLWLEDKKTGIADREIIPLCTASILWIVSALVANYAYASLASVTFVLPYLVYFLPLILLGFYYYVSAPEES